MCGPYSYIMHAHACFVCACRVWITIVVMKYTTSWDSLYQLDGVTHALTFCIAGYTNGGQRLVPTRC